MSLSKSPFILLATWGINMSYTPPNPQPPQHERCSSVPLEKTGYVQWVPFIIRVSSYSEDIQQEKKKLIKRPSDRSYKPLFAPLKYQLSSYLQTLHHRYPNQYCRCSFGTVESLKTFTYQMALQ